MIDLYVYNKIGKKLLLLSETYDGKVWTRLFPSAVERSLIETVWNIYFLAWILHRINYNSTIMQSTPRKFYKCCFSEVGKKSQFPIIIYIIIHLLLVAYSYSYCFFDCCSRALRPLEVFFKSSLGSLGRTLSRLRSLAERMYHKAGSTSTSYHFPKYTRRLQHAALRWKTWWDVWSSTFHFYYFLYVLVFSDKVVRYSHKEHFFGCYYFPIHVSAQDIPVYYIVDRHMFNTCQGHQLLSWFMVQWDLDGHGCDRLRIDRSDKSSKMLRHLRNHNRCTCKTFQKEKNRLWSINVQLLLLEHAGILECLVFICDGLCIGS